MERDVLHLTIPAYAVALARVIDSSLRERPLAISPGDSERSLLQCVSAEASSDGVTEGMPVRIARRLCPALLVLPPDPQLRSRGNRALLKAVSRYTPLVEPSAGGRLFLDLTGSRRLFGSGRDVAARLEKEIATQLRLAGSVGVAGNKLVSQIAAGCLERPGICDVLRGAERNFIAPLSVSVLPGIGPKRELTLLHDLNLRQVQELAELKLPQLRLAFGPFAPLLHQRALGVDPSPVCPPRRIPEIVEESFLLQEENDDALLLAELCRLVEACGQRLRRQQQGTKHLALTVHYADGVQETRKNTLPTPQNHDLILYALAEKLFHTACTRRIRVKGFRLACKKLGFPNQQRELFPPVGVSPRQDSLQKTIDQLRNKYGRQAIQRGLSLVA